MAFVIADVVATPGEEHHSGWSSSRAKGCLRNGRLIPNKKANSSSSSASRALGTRTIEAPALGNAGASLVLRGHVPSPFSGRISLTRSGGAVSNTPPGGSRPPSCCTRLRDLGGCRRDRPRRRGERCSQFRSSHAT